MKSVIQDLKTFRIQQAITQQEVAERAAIAQSDLSEIEQRKKDLRLSTLERLADALGMRLMLIPKQHVPTVRRIAFYQAPEGRLMTPLERYGIADDEEV